jgi:hypothetical protein
MLRRTRELIDAMTRWQDEQLAMLERKTYAELAGLPSRSRLATPPHLKGLKFYISRKTGHDGTVEISVREFTRFLFVVEGSIGPSFEMLPNGEVSRNEYEHDPDD